MGNILQLNEFIDALHDFIDEPVQRRFFIGGMAGTQPFKYAIDAVLSKSEFQNICVIEGCQDYIGMTKASPCNNHFYYADLIVETKLPGADFGSSYNNGFLVWNPMKLEYKYHVDLSDVGRFDYMIINDAQLIPPDILSVFQRSYPGKMIVIFDPYESGAEHFIGYPSIIDALSKQSAIVALARSVFNVTTRSIDKSVRCSVREAKVQRRSIGKNDGNQYVTDNKWLADELWAKQCDMPFRKGQRLWVTDTRMLRLRDLDGRTYTITKDTLIVVDTVPQQGKKLKLKVWNTKFVFESEVTYRDELRIGVIRVRPANVIMTNEVRYHKYPNIVLIPDNPHGVGMLGARTRYVILKNTHNLVVGT